MRIICNKSWRIKMKNIYKLAFTILIMLLVTACGADNAKTKQSQPETEKQKETAMENEKNKEEQVKEKAAEETKKEEKEEKKQEEPKKLVYTTFFPVYDLTSRIIGDKMEIKTIIGISDQPHDFELKANDMAEISKADLIIYNGANMEAFIEDLKAVVKDDSKFLDLSQGLTLLEAGDETGKEHNHENVNPHTWLSVKNAQIQLDTIYQKISSIDPENDAYYKQNLDQNLAEFKKLDDRFEQELSSIQKEKKYFVVSHAAFNYLASDYGLKQVAVTGISPEEEPSAKQLKQIADFVKKNKITTIFFEGKATPKVAETLAKETGTKTDTIYTMENLSEEEAAMGYLKLMEHNLEVLGKSFHE